MTTSSSRAHIDERGVLVAMELDQVGHPVRRIFVVTGGTADVERGGHAAGCQETVVLVAGGAWFWLDEQRHRLEQVGEQLHIRAGAQVRYQLDGPESTLLVAAETPYVPEARS